MSSWITNRVHIIVVYFFKLKRWHRCFVFSHTMLSWRLSHWTDGIA